MVTPAEMCDLSDSVSVPGPIFATMAILYSLYIAVDTIVAALVVRRKLRDAKRG